MSTLSVQQRKLFKQQAHHLNPVVLIGQNGLTDTVMREIHHALTAHELIKIKISQQERNERAQTAAEICQAVSAQLVQHIGKLIIIYRENPDKKTKA